MYSLLLCSQVGCVCLSQLSDSDKEVNAKRCRDVQGVQAESRRRVGEEDGEHVLGVY